jgi:hypothetical protein
MQFRELFCVPGIGLGVAAFWRDCSFGIFDLSADRIEPWGQILATQDSMKRAGLITLAWDTVLSNQGSPNPIPVIVFMDPPPSDGAAWGIGVGTVLDWDATATHMFHEVGHVLGLDHSCGPDQSEYGDPYCVMSAHTFGGTNPVFAADLDELDPAVPSIYWSEIGPRVAAATLYVFVNEFAKSSAVVRVDASGSYPRRLKALGAGALSDPLLAVMQVGEKEWTAEYRAAIGWDRGLDPARPRSTTWGKTTGIGGQAPGPAVVIHSVERTKQTQDPVRPCFQGRILVPLQKGVRDWQSTVDDVRVVVTDVDPADDSVQVAFTRRVARAVQLESDVRTLPDTNPLSPLQPFRSRGTFPIDGGLCGEGTFDFVLREQHQVGACEATAIGGYSDPVYTWEINGVPVPSGSSVLSVATDAYREDGLPPVPTSTTVSLTCAAQDNLLTIYNNPPDGTYDLNISVSLTEKAGGTPAVTAADDLSFRGIKFESDEKDRADAQCRSLWRRRFEKDEGTLDIPYLEKGDPIIDDLAKNTELTSSERSRLIEAVGLLRRLNSDDPREAKAIASNVAKVFGFPLTHMLPRQKQPTNVGKRRNRTA